MKPRTAPPILLMLALAASALAQESAHSEGTLLLLHYRWTRDTAALTDSVSSIGNLTLIESQRVPAAVKTPRLTGAKRARMMAEASETPRSGFSFDLLGPDGRRLSTRFLGDPGVQRVEFQEKGDHGLRSQQRRVDTSDIYLRIPEPEARTIRFYRHARPAAPAAPKAGAAEVLGPQPSPRKTLIAEFPLE
ncbi:MAG: hypothetical protein JWP91_4744 [Fibrobacteres bacterium]|nr:hypothetical protein [Fibrobacterota bacterium]